MVGCNGDSQIMTSPPDDAAICVFCSLPNEEDVMSKLEGCAHRFHTACVAKWSLACVEKLIIPTCPLCRAEYKLWWSDQETTPEQVISMLNYYKSRTEEKTAKFYVAVSYLDWVCRIGNAETSLRQFRYERKLLGKQIAATKEHMHKFIRLKKRGKELGSHAKIRREIGQEVAKLRTKLADLRGKSRGIRHGIQIVKEQIAEMEGEATRNEWC